jgi:LDH2 family malate/lactate/ureidoglycolate dehydrogenase
MPKEEFYERIKAMKKEIKHSPKRQGVDEIRMPGEKKAKTKAERYKAGIQLGNDVLEELKILADENNIEWGFT